MKKIDFNEQIKKQKIKKFLLKIVLFPLTLLKLMFWEFKKEPIWFTLFLTTFFWIIYHNSDKIYAYYESITTKRDYQVVYQENKSEEKKINELLKNEK